MKQLKTDKSGKATYWLGAFLVMITAALLLGLFAKNQQDAAEDECTETLEVMTESTENETEVAVHAEVSESEEWEDAETEVREEESTTEAVEDADAESKAVGEDGTEKTAKQEVSAPSEESVRHPGEISAEEQKEVTKENAYEGTDTKQTEDATAALEPEYSQESTTDEIPTAEPEVSAEAEEHEHSWIFESFYQKPTCSNGGLVTEICAGCGETQITGGTPTGEHTFMVETPGDCCSEEVAVCSECNFREVRDKAPKNHIDVEDGFCYGCGQKAE